MQNTFSYNFKLKDGRILVVRSTSIESAVFEIAADLIRSKAAMSVQELLAKIDPAAGVTKVRFASPVTERSAVKTLESQDAFSELLLAAYRLALRMDSSSQALIGNQPDSDDEPDESEQFPLETQEAEEQADSLIPQDQKATYVTEFDNGISVSTDCMVRWIPEVYDVEVANNIDTGDAMPTAEYAELATGERIAIKHQEEDEESEGTE